MKVLVTGAAGFIGFHVAKRLLARGDEVVGLDNLNAYYDPELKQARLRELQRYIDFRFVRADVADRSAMADLFRSACVNRVVHLAAQAGVRYSVEEPCLYVDSNVVGFIHVLEGCRRTRVEHLVYASTSSVYGGNTRLPFSVRDNVDHPLSLYAATKKANELMAHSYAHLYRLPVTGLRFFTVYGPFGCPDMALFTFTRAILRDEPIPLFNHGHHRRDFTYVDDIVEGVIRVLDRPAEPNPQWSGDDPDPSSSTAPYRVYNIGNQRPVALMQYIDVLQHCLGRTARVQPLPLQPGDVVDTCADVEELARDAGYRPHTTVEEGVRRFVDWYLEYYAADRVASAAMS